MNQQRMPMTGPQPGSNRINVTSLLAGFALGAVLASLAWVQVVPEETVTPDTAAAGQFVPVQPGEQGGGGDGEGATRTTRVIGGDTGGDGGGGAGGAVDVGGGAGPGGAGGGGAGPGGSGAGAGDTTGVSDGSIKFGATYVSGGIACSFLCEVRDAMEAVRSRVNSQGGVHGRKLEITYKADDWDPQRGLTFIQNLINEGVFAFAVSPSSEGLNAAAKAGLFRDNGVPVVGADGLNNSQFIDTESGEANPWIWPVATATTTNVHVIMKDAWERSGGDLEPAIVFGNTYRFGVEGAYAFNQAFKELSGRDIEGYSPGETSCKPNSLYCGIDGGWSGGGEPSKVQDACDAVDCNFLLLLLEPATALNWMENFTVPSSVTGGLGLAGAQPLFTTNFGDQCGEKCNGMVVWTGYKPASEFQQSEAVQAYTQALTAQNSTADVDNQFSMGGYIGMELLVEALEAAGKDLDRGKLVQALNSLEFKSGLTAAPTLSWSASSKYANHSAQGFRMQWNKNQGTFGGFDRATGVEEDDWLGQHNQPPG